MTHATPRIPSLLWAAAAGLGLSLVSALPATAHGFADGGLVQGASHPLLGLDHLLLLVGVGAAASFISSRLLVFALAGALLGALFGISGGTLPLAEALAALSVSGVGLLVLFARRSHSRPSLGVVGAVIAAMVAIHAMLHGQEASAGAALSWWLGAALSSTSVVLLSFAVLRRTPVSWTLGLSFALSLAGGVLALAPLV